MGLVGRGVFWMEATRQYMGAIDAVGFRPAPAERDPLSALQILRDYGSLRRSQWLDSTALREPRERKLHSLVRHAYDTVPFYRERLDQARIRPDDIRSIDDLRKLPVTDKRDLQAAGEGAVRSGQFADQDLKSVRTTGSTGRPFTVFLDERWASMQRAIFLRALTTAGYRFGDKLMILADDPALRRSPVWLRWHYVAYSAPPEQLVTMLNTVKPKLLYGWVTPLRRLALHARDHGKKLQSPATVVTTAEALDADTRQLLNDTFQAEVYEFYGLTEMGMVGIECERHNGLHMSEDTLLAEFPDLEAGQQSSRLVLTNLNLYSMPLIRYATGDVVTLHPAGPCACGRASRRIARVEGREVDCLSLPNGGRLLPYEVTLRMEAIAGIARFQVVQESMLRLVVRYEGLQEAERARAGEIRQVFQKLVAPKVDVDVQRLETIDPGPGQKFRIIESRLGTHPQAMGCNSP
jgi:phenylacetate-CoA ligase